MKLRALRQAFSEQLADLYPHTEVAALFDRTAGLILKKDLIGIHSGLDSSLSESQVKKFTGILQRLRTGEPLQYIMGYTEFYDLEISVKPGVLIPRPETEYLAEIILKTMDAEEISSVMDLCTGSGCLALALAASLPGARVSGMEKSVVALETARQNAIRNNLTITLIQDDLLNPENTYPQFDLIVSNPPYVRDSEKISMHRNVLDHEPAEALFVPDADPLLFYRVIAGFAMKHLKPEGFLFVEINQYLGKESLQLFKKSGFPQATLLQDLDNRDRYIKIIR